MRPQTILVRSALYLSCVVFLAPLNSCAQERVCTPGIQGYVFGSVSPSKPVAFTAIMKTSFEQRLPDGNTVRGYARYRQVRSSSGKTLLEYPMGCHLNEDGEPQLRISVDVQDPATKTDERWFVGDGRYDDKVARVAHWSKPMQEPKLTPEELATRRKLQERNRPPKGEFKTDDLGTRTIAGVEAHGTRTTRTIPAGEEGNDMTLVVVTETWSSKEVGITLMQINDDPRRGRATWEIEEISRTEPDAALFNPPADYKIVDDTPPAETLAKQ